ncbi:PAS domain-containing protein [Cyanobacteria bacterium FACHB-63]|nr:PAS domain-containing protein [Cyanobacteria bacterium FACHB-63]
MKDLGKTREQLLEEIAHLRQRLEQLEQQKSQSQNTELHPQNVQQAVEAPHPNAAHPLTNLWQTEAALRESEQCFRTLCTCAPVGIYLTDVAGHCTYVNDRWCEITQLMPEQATGEGWVKAMHPDDRESIFEQWQALVESGKEFSLEYRFQHPDGSIAWVSGQATAMLDETGNCSGFIGTVSDITDRKQAEAALQRKKERLDLAQTVAKIGCFEWNIQTNENIWSKELEAIYGLKPGEFSGSYEAWASRVHPDDLAQAEADVRQSLNTGELFTDWRIIQPDGDIRWLHARAQVFYDEAGKPLRMVGVNGDITDRKQADAALQESQAIIQARAEELETFMETVPAAVWIAQDPQCHHMTPNRTAYELMRLPFDAVMTATPPDGKYPFPFKIQQNGQDIPPDELPMQHAGRTGQAHEGEFEFVFSENDVRSIYGRAVPLRDKSNKIRGVIGAFLDVTERKQTEKALRESEFLFRTLADTMLQIFWITRADGYHEYFNQRWYDYTGTTLEQARDEGWQSVIHPDDMLSTIEIWQNSLRTGQTYDIEYRLRCGENGEYRWHLGRAFPLRDEKGQILKWFGSCTDIHDQKLVIEERAQALQKERDARLELEKAGRMKDEFLAVLSHELRSPLNGILGWSRLLRTRQLPPEKVEQALASIERNAQAQTQLIEDLLDISRIIQGQMRLNLRPTNLIPSVQAALDTVRPVANAKSIQLECLLNLDLDFISGDPDRLQQIVWNLLTNAIKFTAEGGQVTVRLEQVGAFAQLQVIDTGKGIRSDFLPHVFDRFRLADSTTTRAQGGLGLGLAIVRNLVELHGGQISVASPEEGQGTTFTVRLPLLLSPSVWVEPDKFSIQDQTAQNTAFYLKGLTVLVVDDEADTREFLKAALEHYGASVMTAASTHEALQHLQALKPDLLLSDIGMPEEDGYALIHQVRARSQEQGGKIPAGALTAYATESDRVQILDAGFQIHVPKPVNPAELLKAVMELSGRMAST